ncbi:unnamed protein product, partial [Staurois parvus]
MCPDDQCGPRSATCQCPSVPADSAEQCHVPVHINANLSCLSVSPISATYQCLSVLPIRATYQCPSVMPANAHQC